MEKIYDELEKDIDLGSICDKGKKAWVGMKGMNAHELLEQYKKWVEYCLDNHFPTKEKLKEMVGGIHREHNIYIDEKVDVRLSGGRAIFLGECSGKVRCDGRVSVDIYVQGGHDLEISSTGGAYVAVTLSDGATATLSHDKYSDIHTYNN